MVIGPYKLLEQIGEGGMGLVFVAEQQRPVRRKVAFKVIKPGMDTRQVVARFEAERQALAMMDHPNIAKVLDGGETASGRPYFVMELVKGVPITDYCDGNRVPVRERLGLFLDVCRAVQHAHQKAIIHRDLKPSNVLVVSHDGTPVVKVIDFGVAKATGGRLTDKTVYTHFAQLIGTLEYMSPEQAGQSGLDVDTRSDIYALGVLLYELLTGTTPFDRERLRAAGPDELRRILRGEEPPPPSTRLSTLGPEAAATVSTNRRSEPRPLRRLVRGELDWVVMKALEKDRGRRYETAGAFAADVQRHLADEPVEARPPSTAYRLGKFLKRNKGPAAAAGLVLLALVGGIAGTSMGMLRADRALAAEAGQRARAERARDRAREALDAMTSSVTGDSLTTQTAVSDEQKKFLREVLTYYQEFAGEKADDEKARSRTAHAAHRVGLIEYRLGRLEEAASAFRLARDGFAQLVADFPAVPGYRQNLATSHGNLGVVLSHLGKGAEAERECRRALALYERLAADSPAVPKYRQELASSHYNLARLLHGLGKLPEAERHLRGALALYEKLAADSPAVPQYRRELAISHNRLGVLLSDLGKRKEAGQHHRRALALDQKLAADSPAVPEYRLGLAISHNALGIMLAGVGKVSGAEQHYRRALALLDRLAADFPSAPEHHHYLANCHNNLGVLLKDLGKGAEAEREYRQALALFAKLAADFPTVPKYRRRLAGSHRCLGTLLRGLGKLAEAEPHYRRALALDVKLVADSPNVPDYRHDLAHSHNGLGVLLDSLGKGPEAGRHLRRALALVDKLAADSPAVPEYRLGLASSHNNMGKMLER
jgi:tetratricopeptide (TPR) repeat protein